MLRFGLLICVCLFFLGCALLFAFGSAGSPCIFSPMEVNALRQEPLEQSVSFKLEASDHRPFPGPSSVGQMYYNVATECIL